MANLFGDIDWCWGSLKPWQLLHSKLAEKERYGSMMDVWELIDQTLGSDLTRFSKGREESGHERRRSHGGLLLQLLGEDGEYWSHGGVMEARIREGLVRSWDEDDNSNTAERHESSNNQRINDGSNAAIRGDDQMRYCTAASSWRTETETVGASESAQLEIEEEEEVSGGNGNDSEEEEDVDDEIYYDNDDNGGNDNGINNVVMIRKCCSSASTANTTKQQVVPNLAVSDNLAEDPSNLAETPPLDSMGTTPLDLADTAPLCPVCLEKLTQDTRSNNNENNDISNNYEGQINEGDNESVVQLGCRHVFHAECLSPWLQRQPHACCPCCRAPIPQCYYWQYCLPQPPTLAGSPPDLGAPAGHGIMRLLADVEAVLDQLGLRS